jgi:hypothetical protein
MMNEAAIKIGSHSVIANMFHSMFPERFAYLRSGKGVGWFEFIAPRWHHIAETSQRFYTLLNEDFTDKFEDSIILLEEEDCPDDELIETLKPILNKRLGKSDFKDNDIKELRAKYNKVNKCKEWLSSLNTNKNLLGF